MGEPGGLPSTGSHRVRRDWSDFAAAAAESWKDETIYSIVSRVNNTVYVKVLYTVYAKVVTRVDLKTEKKIITMWGDWYWKSLLNCF